MARGTGLRGGAVFDLQGYGVPRSAFPARRAESSRGGIVGACVFLQADFFPASAEH